MNELIVKAVEIGIAEGGCARIRYSAKSVQDAVEFSDRLKLFVEGAEKHCPYCGRLAARCTKANELLDPVTIEPCGCELWQGPIPQVWRR
jgi:predicted RNA-binding Zn-ribbon protein involved in translation (DUF1610 family)